MPGSSRCSSAATLDGTLVPGTRRSGPGSAAGHRSAAERIGEVDAGGDEDRLRCVNVPLETATAVA